MEMPADIDFGIKPLVEILNSIGLSPYSSCEGHENCNIIQFSYPIVAISIDENNKDSLLRFIRMLGIYNDNCHGMNDIRWCINPNGENSAIIMPIFSGFHDLKDLQDSIIIFADSLKKIDKWYKSK